MSWLTILSYMNTFNYMVSEEFVFTKCLTDGDHYLILCSSINKWFIQFFLKITIIRLFRNHANSDHVPSFSSLDVWNVRLMTSGVYAITVTTSKYHSRISCSVPLCLSDNRNISGHIVFLFMMLTAVNKVRKQIHCLCIEVFNTNKAKQQNLLASRANF
jgi:hypothetical protein